MFLPIAFCISFFLLILPHYITATTLIKRPAPFWPISFRVPSDPGSTEHSPRSGAPITAPVCSAQFGSPSTAECVCARLAMERDNLLTPMTSYYGGQLRFISDIPGVLGYLSTPRVYSCGTCIITIYPLQIGEYDRATRDVVKFTAGRIILECMSGFVAGHDERRMGGLNIAGVDRKLYISVFDVPWLPRPLRYRSGVGQVNDPDILRYLNDRCNWPPSSSSPNSHDDAGSANFRLLCGDGGGADGNANGDSGAGDEGDEGKAIQALREEMKEEVGQSMCTTAGGEGGCGDGVSCREASWRGVVAQVLFGVESIVQGSGICVFE